jgi:hypothetical protein
VGVRVVVLDRTASSSSRRTPRARERTLDRFGSPRISGQCGRPGLHRQKCESLLNSYEQNRGAAENYAKYGDVATSLAAAEYAGTIKQELENNCLTVD